MKYGETVKENKYFLPTNYSPVRVCNVNLSRPQRNGTIVQKYLRLMCRNCTKFLANRSNQLVVARNI